MSAASMVGRIILVTGASDGIGKHTALKLAQMGATVLMHGRNTEKIHHAKREIAEKTGNKTLEVYTADLASLREVHHLSEDIHSKYSRLDVLINNAGVYMLNREESKDGYEMTFAVNVLAPFLLTSLLLDLLKAGKSSRIVHVSSISHLNCNKVNLDDLNSKLDYRDGRPAYALSKVCEIMYTYKMAELLQDANITVNCLDPGTVNTNMLLKSWGPVGIPVGEANFVYQTAADPALDGVTGRYFVDNKDTKSSAISYDKTLQDKVWDILVKLTGATF
ncbi:retinol dehydrogenase 14-like [Acanthaster planci]|uniref:Retinol dehydrogenase 14-like n=1 Tax=Acanthaster planci TaxID=133434 RepID=A0A8B7YIP5_ACAPL|nr:retinol dehydrogenase 14-like [Acanthaster planci]XP_022093125.1 retinol dehydrogenase 14-like [Acanthaster planci]XP_022093126.1 retinol dehydrogenase 14-like [Acanthaster planci]XP_022093127.1 retinol dehydrogenase 14-like [Acanthaster planci]